jgi:hypothetical protein
VTLRDRVQANVVVAQLLAEERDVLGVSRQSIERLAHDHIDLARLDERKQPFQAWPNALVAGLLRIVEGRDNRTIEKIDELHARRSLVFA